MSRNKFKFRREIIAAGGIVSTGGCQFDAASTFSAAVTFAVAPIFSAGITNIAQKSGLILSTGGYVADHVQALTDDASLSDASTGGTAILGYGVTTITVTGATGPAVGGSSANNLIFKLNSPVKAGVHKRIYVTGTSASTKVVSVRTASSVQPFFGSTKNSIAYTTTVNNLGYGFPILLDAISTSQWAVCGLPGVPSTASVVAAATA
jgi:hypothetical protein